jgi:hypothetical protein
MQEKVRIENLNQSNIEDLIYVCSSKMLRNPIHQKGISLKKRWLMEMLKKHGPCAKIAYYNEKPVAQILYYPEHLDVKAFRRQNVLVINCIYNPNPEAQKLGISTKLLQSVIEDLKQRKTSLGNKPCKFVMAKAFDTGEFLPLPEFYKKMGFINAPENEEGLLYLPVEGGYEPAAPVGEYEPLLEDKGRAVIFYSPICQFSYQFAKKAEETIREVAAGMKIEIINEWENPQEAIKRRNSWLIVNAKQILTFLVAKERFREEIKRAIGSFK